MSDKFINFILAVIGVILFIVFIYGYSHLPCEAFSLAAQKNIPARCANYFYGGNK